MLRSWTGGNALFDNATQPRKGNLYYEYREVFNDANERVEQYCTGRRLEFFDKVSVDYLAYLGMSWTHPISGMHHIEAGDSMVYRFKILAG